MAWTVALTVLIFYCIPSSKRSVYLLPMYPFMAMGLAWLFAQCRTAKFMRIFTRVLALLAIIAPIALTMLSHMSLGHLRLYTPAWWQYIMTFCLFSPGYGGLSREVAKPTPPPEQSSLHTYCL